MKTIRYDPNEWDAIWNRLAKDHSALSMGKALGFTLREETEVCLLMMPQLVMIELP